jgi:precorrin-6B methylase 2
MWKNLLLLLFCCSLQALPSAPLLPQKNKNLPTIRHQKECCERTLGDAVFYGKTIPFNPHETFLEVGSKTGVIALLIANRGAEHTIAVDIHPDALDLAQQQALSLNLGDKFTPTVQSVADFLSPDAQFDVVFLNEGAEAENLDFFRQHLKPTGRLFIGTTSDVSKYATAGWELRVIATDRCTCIKETVIIEAIPQ